MSDMCYLCYHPPHPGRACQWPVDDHQDMYTVPCGCGGEDT